jgi:antitoxin ParD1/3/4
MKEEGRRKKWLSGLPGRGRSRKLGAVGTVTITLRDEDRHFIKRAMEEGRYVSESEAVADALSELRAREELRQARLGELREKIAAGIAQLDRGEGAEWSAEEIRREGEARLGAGRAG